MKLFVVLLFLSFPLRAEDLPKPRIYLGDQVKEYMAEQGLCLAPPLVHISNIRQGKEAMLITLTDSYGDSATVGFKDGHLIKADEEPEQPYIIKIKRVGYAILREGQVAILKIEDGAEGLFDKFYGIQKPPPPPNRGDSSDGWKEDQPDRFKWKP